MMYTDLALEAAELRARELPPQGKLDGVVSRHESRGGFEVDFVEIISEEGERVLEKPKGKYITLDILPAVRREENAFAQACSLVAEYLKPLLRAGRGPWQSRDYAGCNRPGLRAGYHGYSSCSRADARILRLFPSGCGGCPRCIGHDGD